MAKKVQRVQTPKDGRATITLYSTDFNVRQWDFIISAWAEQFGLDMRNATEITLVVSEIIID